MQIEKAIKSGAVIIYPTDTVYGIGCNAKLKESVKRVRELKKQFDRPFSVIAPSIEWIEKNLESKKEVRDKLPGPYTFILKIKQAPQQEIDRKIINTLKKFVKK